MESRGKPRVLAVDDDRLMLASWRTLLQGQFDLTLVDDPLAARDRFEAEDFDAALIDLQMPSMDGLALLTQLRASQPHCAAFMVSGHATVGAAVTALQLAALEAYLWPGNIRELANALEHAVAMTDGAAIPAPALLRYLAPMGRRSPALSGATTRPAVPADAATEAGY